MCEPSRRVVSQTISKQIAALEEHLDVQLLIRSTRSLSLTEAGTRFYEHCQRVLETVAEAEASVGQRQRPSGLLRLSCPVSFGQLQIVPRLKAFLDRYPDIKIDLMMAEHYIDLVEEGVDLAIRIGQVQDTSLISHRLGMTRRIAIASLAYFAKVRCLIDFLASEFKLDPWVSDYGQPSSR